MPLQHFDDEPPPRPARLTETEMQDVLALWQQEQDAGLSARPRAEDVAEGLNVPVSEIERLLQLIRARRADEEKRLSEEQAKLDAETRRAQAERDILADLRRQRVQVRQRTARTRQARPANGARADAVITGVVALVLAVLVAAWTLVAVTALFAPTVPLVAKFILWAIEAFLLPLTWNLGRQAWRGFTDWLALRRLPPPE